MPLINRSLMISGTRKPADAARADQLELLNQENPVAEHHWINGQRSNNKR